MSFHENMSFKGCYSQNDIQIIPVVLGSANHTIRDAHHPTTQKGVSLVSSLPAGTQEIKSCSPNIARNPGTESY
jgi:hypothetical protein